ncbi:MAG: glycine--tRNA ligase subunit beta, partial [Natronospirillum sp.]
VAKRMRWGSNRYEFVRPVKWLLALLGDQVLPMEGFGLTANNLTYGHRIHAPNAIAIQHPGEYLHRLREEGKVMADFAARQQFIAEQVAQAAQQHGVTALVSDDLLSEVASLNEWPVVLSGEFEERFLEVPAEALITSMEEHQKYFAATDSAGELVNRFFFVANLESKDPAVVISGNEKVIRPRLSDAAFFWENDQKVPLADRVASLDKVVFHNALGSVGDKSRRISALAASLARGLKLDEVNAQRAAWLAKADLVTDLVFEFDHLQGLAGYYYALKDGEAEAVALAIRDQYKPGFAGDSLPTTDVGAVVALADRLDTLVGIFGIGQKPSGTKDPFALRRASLGVLRLVIEKRFALDLEDVLALALKGYDEPSWAHSKSVVAECLAYILERFRAMYQDEGISPDVFYAVRELGLSQPLDIDARVRGVSAFKALPVAASLCESNKRVANLLSKTGLQVSDTPTTLASLTALTAPAEGLLIDQLETLQSTVEHTVASGDYAAALAELSKLKLPLDQFFNDVMVMADDPALREQRLALLAEVRRLFLKVADISLLQL